MSTPSSASRVSVIVVHRRLRGYPDDCLRSLAASAPKDCEFILVCGPEFDAGTLQREMPFVRVLRTEGDRAAARNLGIREARGAFLLLTASDMIARPGAVSALRNFLRDNPSPEAVVSAQILQENGMRRRTSFPAPSVWREVDPRIAARHLYARIRKGVPPPTGRPVAAPALHAAFLMADRKTVERVGTFQEGHRFACEDIHWCRRAASMGVRLFIHPEARAFKVAPQLCGPLAPDVRVALEASIWRLAMSLDGGNAVALRGIRRGKSLLKWIGASALQALLGGRSRFLADSAEAHRRIAFMRRSEAAPQLPDDIESTVRWEMVF